VSDWGTVCVAVRPTRPHSLDFWAAWTALITRGLRRGDVTLVPNQALPGHQAANVVAQSFMDTGRDTLLMIDDDQIFEADTLERLRSNEANWEYDVVCPFVTRRTWPPLPVILRRHEPQPEDAPLVGTYYDPVVQFEEGAALPVDTVGLPFTLIRRRVFEAMVDERLGPERTDYFRYGPQRVGPDVMFSEACVALGFKLAVDTSVKIGHVGAMTLGWNEFVAWREAHRANH